MITDSRGEGRETDQNDTFQALQMAPKSQESCLFWMLWKQYYNEHDAVFGVTESRTNFKIMLKEILRKRIWK